MNPATPRTATLAGGRRRLRPKEEDPSHDQRQRRALDRGRLAVARLVSIVSIVAIAFPMRLRDTVAAPDELAIHEDVVDDGEANASRVFDAGSVGALVDDQIDALDVATGRDGRERRSRAVRKTDARPFGRILRRRCRGAVCAPADEVKRGVVAALARHDIEPR